MPYKLKKGFRLPDAPDELNRALEHIRELEKASVTSYLPAFWIAFAGLVVVTVWLLANSAWVQ